MQIDTTSTIKDIQSIFGVATGISTPKTAGVNNTVYIAHPAVGGRYIVKANIPQLAQKNATVAHILNDAGIPAPKIEIIQCGDNFYETYPAIDGATLFNRVRNGMSPSHIRTAYQQMIEAMVYINTLSSQIDKTTPFIHYHQVVRTNLSHQNGRAMAHIFTPIVCMMNIGRKSDYTLNHFDLNQKNVIVDSNGRLNGIIDMDTVALCDKNYAFAMMAAKYIETGYNIQDLFKHYAITTTAPLNQHHVERIVKLCIFGKNMLWRHRRATHRG